MLLVVLTVTAGVLVGWRRGGHLRNLDGIRLRRPALVGIAVISQLVLAFNGPGSSARPVLLAVVNVALLAFTWANRLLPGTGLLLVGFALNAAVITANAGMPVSPSALQAIGEQPATLAQGKHRILKAGDRLTVLADVLPVPALHSVYSAGDIAVAAGAGALVANLMGPARRGAI